jgi:hypothetical protein
MLRSESNALVSYLATLPFVISWLAACWWIVTHTTQFLWDLRLRSDELVVVILGFVPVWRIPLSEISAIHKTTWSGLMKLSYGRGLTTIFNRCRCRWNTSPRNMQPAGPGSHGAVK